MTSQIYVPVHVVVVQALGLAACLLVLVAGLASAQLRLGAVVAALGGLVFGVPTTVFLVEDVAQRRGRTGVTDYLLRHPQLVTDLDWCYGVGLVLVAVGFALVARRPRATRVAHQPIETL